MTNSTVLTRAAEMWALSAANRWSTPGALARALDPDTRQTRALDLIDAALVDVAEGRCDRLIISMPPQEGKSSRVTTVGALWFLLRKRHWRIAIASYSEGLAVTFGRLIRNYIADHQGRDGTLDLGVRIAADNGAVTDWTLAGNRGGIRSVGIGTGLTGRPVDCVSGDTRIECEHGWITAAEAFQRGITRIRAYDHATGRAVWRDVEAARRIPGRRVVEVVTVGGRRIVCTPDHRVYTGRGYAPAGDLRPGDALVAIVAPGRVPLREPVGGAEAGRAPRGTARHEPLLLAGVRPGRARADATVQTLPSVRRPGPAEPEGLLRGSVSRSRPSRRGTVEDVPGMLGHVQAEVIPDGVLLAAVLERRALQADEGPRELPVHPREGVLPMVPGHAAADPGTRSGALRGMPRGTDDDAHLAREATHPLRPSDPSHRRGRHEQPAGEPHHPVRDVPCGAPQVEGDTVAVVLDRGGQPVDVYDFQVAGTRNFFGDGLLVHNCLIIDDPIKDREQADSETYRERAKNWWRTVGSTRLAPGAPVVLILCMTGDTPVLLASGIEKPLRDIQPGEAVATFTDEGEVTTSVVSNWMSQGEDDILTLSMASGRVVRANARHPFWVIDETGEGSWVQLGSLQAGMKVRCLTALTEGSSAPQVDATSPRSARACACRTTPEHAMQPVIGHRRHLMKAGGGSDSRVGMASRPKTTIDSSLSRMGVVRSVEGMSAKSPSPRTGPKSSVSIIATTPEQCEVCSATTATSSLLAGTRPTSSDGPLSTSVVSTDEIISIAPSGREEVFDIEVVGTHRFIANGLDVSNTRWHHDDLAGYLLGQPDKDRWRVINIPAQAEHRPDAGESDILGREPGEYMDSARIDERTGLARSSQQWEQTKIQVGPETWAALYQGSPTATTGNILPRDKWRQYDTPLWIEDADGRRFIPGLQAEDAEMIQSWDFTFKDTAASDYVVGQVWLRRGIDAYLLDQVRARMDFTASCQAMLTLSARWPQAIAKLVEDKANGPAILNALRSQVGGLIPVEPEGSKVARARAISPLQQAGNLWLPSPMLAPWVGDFIEEAAQFPHGKNDDQVDGASQAVHRLLLVPILAGQTLYPEDVLGDGVELDWVADLDY